ncbi:MAG: ROK family glucokinase [Roseburia sp.]|nr:ROK family glucokinase [Roseburia sp.]
MKKYAFGVDIGGTTCKIGFFDTAGVLLDKWEIPTNTANAGEAILSDVAHAIENKLVTSSIAKEDVQGVGVGVPGAVTDYRVVHGCENLGWETVEVARELEQLTGLQVKVENDANMAVLGEMWKGGAAGSKNVMLVTLGTGVGAGIISGGHIVTGSSGGAGEIGHMVVDYNETEQCSCGKYGCLEQYASATGIVRLAKRRAARVQDARVLYGVEDMTTLSAKDIFDAAKAGDEEALTVVDEVCKILGIALANVACALNPEVIVIGGGVSKAGDILIQHVEKHFEKYVFYACKNVRFALATLENDAGIWGCVRLLLSE